MPTHKRRPKFRSSMEKRIVPGLLALGGEYEPERLKYTKDHYYVPDVRLANGIYIEIKGWFRPADRAKMLEVKKAHPLKDIRMVLASPHQRLNKKSKTTQAQWCDKHGIPWAAHDVPLRWVREKGHA